MVSFLENYSSQSIAHAWNLGECVFKLRNKWAFPDRYSEVPATWYTPINAGAFVKIKNIEVDDDLKQRNEHLWCEMSAAERVAMERIAYMFNRYQTNIPQEPAYAAARSEVVRVWKYK